MSVFDKVKNYIRGEQYEEDEVLEEETGEESTRRWRTNESVAREEKAEPVQRSYSESRPASGGKVVSINTLTQLSVVLVKPERYDQAAEIADHLKEKRTVVLNLEQTNREVARRLLDFLSGVAYANEGKTTKVANSTYIITPYNVTIQGDIIDELENNGLYV